MLNWVEKEKAPKDGKCIIAKFKTWPQALMAMWCAEEDKWVAAAPQCCEMEGGSDDRYFENEWFDEHDLTVWAECT